jgi:ABC-type glycerol-3-phosphate transport system substrate-binding protein
MKTRKMALMVLVAFGLVAVFSVSAYAAAANCVCTVSSAGTYTWTGSATDYKTAIKLTWVSGGTTPGTKVKTFYAPTNREKDFLAIALTAMANGKKVTALVDFITASTVVNNLYLNP